MLLAACLLCVPQIAAAESLPDPTRPAIDLSGGAGGAADAAPVETAPQGLQSTIISPEYRAAIINGKTVRLGGKVGDSRLIEVRENSVVLQNAQGRRVMELFPKVSIKQNEVAPQKSGAQEKTTEQPSLPEKDVGGVK
jgi:MSHA biogenesis protein MshK